MKGRGREREKEGGERGRSGGRIRDSEGGRETEEEVAGERMRE